MKVYTDDMDMQDDLLISYLLGEALPDEKNQVEEWLSTDENCKNRFVQFHTLWVTSKNPAATGPIDAQAALYRFKQKAATLTTANDNVKTLKKGRTWMAAAAAILLAACMWLYFMHSAVKDVQLITSTAPQAVTLPDGSVITLNRASYFEYPSKFEGNLRNVKLDSGEAFFSVAHNKARPFIVAAGRVSIQVVGTSFNVKYKRGSVEVIVETGVVRVGLSGRMVVLKPGEKILIKPNSTELKKESNTDRLYTYYRSKEFVADDTPLWRMVEVLNEAYDSHIVIGRKELRNLPLNTTFNNESLDKILDVIARTFNITVEKEQGQIILK